VRCCNEAEASSHGTQTIVEKRPASGLNNSAGFDLVDRNDCWAALRFVFKQHRSGLAIQDPSEVHIEPITPCQPNEAFTPQQNLQSELQAVFVLRRFHGSPLLSVRLQSYSISVEMEMAI